MRIQTNKTKRWRMARDYGAQPPGLWGTELICYESGSYGLTWPGGAGLAPGRGVRPPLPGGGVSREMRTIS